MLIIFFTFNIFFCIGFIAPLVGGNVSQELILLPRKQLKPEIYSTIQQQCKDILAKKSDQKSTYLSDRFDTLHNQHLTFYQSLVGHLHTIQSDTVSRRDDIDPNLRAWIEKQTSNFQLLKKLEVCKKLCNTNPDNPRWTLEYEKIKKQYYDLYFLTQQAPSNRYIRAQLNELACPILKKIKKRLVLYKQNYSQIHEWSNTLRIAPEQKIFSHKILASFVQLDKYLAHKYEFWRTATVLGQLYETLQGKRKSQNTIKEYLSHNNAMVLYHNTLRTTYNNFRDTLIKYIQESPLLEIAIPPLSRFNSQDYKMLTDLISRLYNNIDDITTLSTLRSSKAPELNVLQSRTLKKLEELTEHLNDFHAMLKSQCFICRKKLKKSQVSCPSCSWLHYCSFQCLKQHTDHENCSKQPPSFALRAAPCLASIVQFFYDDISFIIFQNPLQTHSKYKILGYNPRRRFLQQNFFLKPLSTINFFDPLTSESFSSNIAEPAQFYQNVLTNNLYVYDEKDHVYKEVIYAITFPDEETVKHCCCLNHSTETTP